MSALKEQLKYTIDLRIPGFQKSVPPGTVGQKVFEECASERWFSEFVDRCENSIGKSHFPVFRVSDGEFYFATRLRSAYAPQGVNPLWHHIRFLLGSLRLGRYPWRFRSGSPNYGWEEFACFEWMRLQRQFVTYMRHIANEGVFAVNFTVTSPPFSEQYFESFCDWLDKNRIPINHSNYYPFYFVYGLLLGPESGRILEGKKILVATSFDEKKKQAIMDGLHNVGVQQVAFLPLSRNKAMKDMILLPEFADQVDVVLIGAGVGASNILYQLRGIQTLCIDAGYCLECLADPQKRYSRVFCMPDRFPIVRVRE